MTPGLMLERGNFARDILFPNINFIPPDRYNGAPDIRSVADKIRQGMDITSATMPDMKSGVRAESNAMADRDEEFNTRYGSFRGWQLAIEPATARKRYGRALLRLRTLLLNEGVTESYL